MSFPVRLEKLTSARLIRQRDHRDDIRRLRMETLMVPHVHMVRLLDELLHEHGDHFHMSADAKLLLHAAGEAVVTELFDEAGRVVEYMDRETVNLSDLQFAQGKWLNRSTVCADDSEADDCME